MKRAAVCLLLAACSDSNGPSSPVRITVLAMNQSSSPTVSMVAVPIRFDAMGAVVYGQADSQIVTLPNSATCVRFTVGEAYPQALVRVYGTGFANWWGLSTAVERDWTLTIASNGLLQATTALSAC